MVKNKGVAYVPYVSTEGIKQEVEKVITQDLALYHDPGIKYETYAKVNLGGGRYKLLPQTNYNKTQHLVWNAASGSLTLNLDTEQSFKDNNHYMLFLSLTANVDINTWFIIEDYATGNNLGYFMLVPNSNNFQFIDFSSSPLKIDRYILGFKPVNPITGVALVITGQVLVNFLCFKEQKS